MTDCQHIHLKEVGLSRLVDKYRVKTFARCEDCGSWLERTWSLMPCDAGWKIIEKKDLK